MHAVECPSCGAPLHFALEDTAVVCEYCEHEVVLDVALGRTEGSVPASVPGTGPARSPSLSPPKPVDLTPFVTRAIVLLAFGFWLYRVFVVAP